MYSAILNTYTGNNMIELYLLEQLIAVDEHPTLNAAANFLHLTQPTLSRSMQKIEKEFGVPIFDRKRNNITLNENGKRAVKYARRILKIENEMMERVRLNVMINIGFVAPGPQMLVDSIAQSHSILIHSEMQKDDMLYEGLIQEKYDLIVMDHIPDDMNVYGKKLCKEHLFLSVPSAHPFTKYHEISAHQVNGTTFVMAENIGIWKDIVAKYMPESKFLLQDSLDALSQIVISSSIAAFATNITLTLSHSSEERIYIPFSDAGLHLQFYVCCLKEKKELLENVLSALTNIAEFDHQK